MSDENVAMKTKQCMCCERTVPKKEGVFMCKECYDNPECEHRDLIITQEKLSNIINRIKVKCADCGAILPVCTITIEYKDLTQ